jgi:hypothetical protein
MALSFLQHIAFSVIGILMAINMALQISLLIWVSRFGESRTLFFWVQLISFYIMLGLALCLLFGGEYSDNMGSAFRQY